MTCTYVRMYVCTSTKMFALLYIGRYVYTYSTYCTLPLCVEQLLLFQVTDAMNRHGVKILSVQGQCVSSDCDPCSCEGEPSAVNMFGTFKEKTLVLSFIKDEGEDRKKFLHDFDLQRTRLSPDYCFVVWVGRSVPGKVRSEVQREVRVGGGDCVVLPVNGFPWKVGSPEEKQFVQSLYLSQVEVSTLAILTISSSTCYLCGMWHVCRLRELDKLLLRYRKTVRRLL